MSFCTRPTVAAKKAVIAPTIGDHHAARSAQLEHRRQAADHEHARRSPWSRRGSARRPASGLPSRPAARCAGNCADLPIAPMNSSRQSMVIRRSDAQEVMVAPAMPARRRRSSSNRDRAEHQNSAEDAEREAEIADAVDDEGLDRGGVGRGLACTRSRSAGRRRGPRLPSRRTSAPGCPPSPASAWRR
jgi:hypothetical protein